MGSTDRQKRRAEALTGAVAHGEAARGALARTAVESCRWHFGGACGQRP